MPSPWIQAALRWLRPARNESRAQICHASDGIRLRLGERDLWQLTWTEAVEIAAFKTDHWGFDRICLAFRSHAHEREYACLHEHMEGWDELTREVDRRFNNAFSKSWREVVFPAFAPQWRTIWGEPTPDEPPRKLSWPDIE